MTAKRGYAKVAELRGVPVWAHWSLPLGGAIVSLYGQVEPQQWMYYCMAFVLLVVVHELGHVLAAVALRLKVFSVEISGMGGLVRFERPRRIRDSVLVYTAGQLAQIAAFLLTIAYVKIAGPPTHPYGRALVNTFTIVNASVFVVNLIPYRDKRSGLSTDGSMLWRLFLHVYRGHPHPHPPLVATPAEQSPVFPPETRLLSKPGFRPPGYVHGVEILNDRTTPMDFVVTALTAHLGLTRDQAVVKMLDIHNTGGMLFAFSTEQQARSVADAVSADAKAAGHAFVCRYAGP